MIIENGDTVDYYYICGPMFDYWNNDNGGLF